MSEVSDWMGGMKVIIPFIIGGAVCWMESIAQSTPPKHTTEAYHTAPITRITECD